MVLEQDGPFRSLGMRRIDCGPKHCYKRHQNPSESLHCRSLLEIKWIEMSVLKYTLLRARAQCAREFERQGI